MSTNISLIKNAIAKGIKTNYIYMFVFVGFAIGFLIICSLLLALTDQANVCVSNKDLTNTGYIFSSFGIVISIALLVCGIKSSDNMKKLLEMIRSRFTKRVPGQ